MPGKKPVSLQIDPTKVTIAEAQKLMRPLTGTLGVICPCCRQVSVVQEKRITSSMAYVLILLHRHFQGGVKEWLNVGNYLSTMSGLGAFVKGGEWSKLEHWGLIEEKPKPKPTQSDQGKWAGLYRITDRGHQFVLEKGKVPKTVRLYNGKLIGYGKGAVGIRDCLGEDLKYEDLIEGRLGGFIV
jgi:hypothetical protein